MVTSDVATTPQIGDTMSESTNHLHLTSVLTGDLPTTIGTDAAPEAYSVPVVLSRRATTEEKKALESPESRATLAQQGWPDARLTVSDRRLVVEHTSLEQLADGLARELDGLLSALGDRIGDARAVREDEARVAQESERERQQRVQALADAVTFGADASRG